jgi:outer membrane lipoprotein carrier protein
MWMRKFMLITAAGLLGAACGQSGDRPPDPPASPDQITVDTLPAAPAEVPAPDTMAATPDAGPAAAAPRPGAPAAGGATPGAAAAASSRTPVAGGTAAPADPVPAAGGTAADEGAAALQRAAAAYEDVRSLRADFIMEFENPLLRQRLTSRGTIFQRQPDRIAVRFSDPDGDLIVGDGQYFWVYYPSNNAQQVMRSPAAAAGQSAVNLQAQFVGNPVERFNYRVEGAASVGGRPAQVLLLAPRQAAQYRSLKVWIDRQDSLVRRFEITEHNGSVRRFDLQNLQVNAAMPDGVFRFTPPAGARVIDAG